MSRRETDCDGLRCHHTSKNDVQFKTDYKLFTSGILHLVFLGLGCPWIIKTTETERVDKGQRIHCCRVEKLSGVITRSEVGCA